MENYSLLLIDDAPEICDHFKMVFEAFEYNVTTFIDPKKAYIEGILEKQYHIIFIDYHMPLINGVKLFKMTRESTLNKDSYIIAYTSESDKLVQEQIFESGFDDIIIKPMDERTVNIKLKAIIKRYFQDENITDKKNPFKPYSNYDYTLHDFRLNLTPTQYDIFKFLMINRAKVLGSKDILSGISTNTCNDCGNSPTDCVRQQVAKIRTKINKIDPNREYIITFLQKGYKLIV